MIVVHNNNDGLEGKWFCDYACMARKLCKAGDGFQLHRPKEHTDPNMYYASAPAPENTRCTFCSRIPIEVLAEVV
jgi:hypothetical protein